MKRFTTFTLIALAAVVLGGCKEAQLGGPVTNADIYVDLLSQPGASFQEDRTTSRVDVTREIGPERYSQLNDNGMFFRLGNFEVDPELVMPLELYFITAVYGEDTDTDKDGKVDNAPVDVEGEWHAIMDGATLRDCGFFVSALTEAAYQYVRPQINLVSDEELLNLLDEFAALVIADVNRDGVVNYADVLAWTRLYSEDQYLGDIAFLDALADQIRSGGLDYIVQAAAESVWRNRYVQPILPSGVPGTPIGGSVQGDMVLAAAMSPYDLDAPLSVNGDLLVEAGVIIRGNTRQITVNGDLQIQGVPRQLVTLDEVSIVISNFGSSMGSMIEYAHLRDGSLLATIKQLTMENSYVEDSLVELRTSTNDAGNQALIRFNVLEDSQVTMYNKSPVRELFEITFVNNLFVPSESNASKVISKWLGPVQNLMIKNNSFHPNMRMRRFDSAAVMNLQENYWGVESTSEIDMDEVIPDNDPDEFDSRILYNPRLSEADPDTPRLLD